MPSIAKPTRAIYCCTFLLLRTLWFNILFLACTMLRELNNKVQNVSHIGPIIRQAPHEEIDWRNEGSCVGIGPELFFPEKGQPTTVAKEICKDCVVRIECHQFAVENDERFGIWGGIGEQERRRLRRQRKLARIANTGSIDTNDKLTGTDS